MKFVTLGALCTFLFSSIGTVTAQTYSTEDVRVQGLQVSRFLIDTHPTAAFLRQPHHQQWHSQILDYVCWSGLFLISQEGPSSCKTTQPDVNFRMVLDYSKWKKAIILQILSKKRLIAEVSLPATSDTLPPKQTLKALETLLFKITGVASSFQGTIAFELRQPRRLKVIVQTDMAGSSIQGVSQQPHITLFPEWHPHKKALTYLALSNRGSLLLYYESQKKERVLSNFPQIHSGGTWSPDGKSLMLAMSQQGNTDLYQYDFASQQLVRLTSHAAIDTHPAISPDGKYLAFVSDRTGKEQLHLMDLAAKDVFRLTFSGHRNTDPSWSPDSQTLAFTRTQQRRDQIYLMEPFSGKEQRLVAGDFHAESADWSPNGQQLVFTANPTGDYKLYVIGVDGKGMRRLTQTPKGFQETAPAWSAFSFSTKP